MKNRQAMKMTAAVIVLVIVVAAYFGISMWNKSEADKEEAENASIELLDITADDIDKFSYEYNGETITFVKEDGTWYLDSDRDFPVKQTSIEGKLSSVASTTASREIEISEDNLADYGLDEPVNTITVTDNNGNETIFEIGDQNGTSSEYYCRLNESNKVYMISSSLDSMMSFDVYTVADMSTFPTISSDSIKELTVDDGNQSKVLDKDEDSSAFTAISSLYYTNQIDYDCEDMSKYGLDEPQYTVTIKYLEETEDETEEDTDTQAADETETLSDETSETGDTEETEETYDEADLTTVTLYIGDSTDSGYYVRVDDSTEVHMISSDDVENITGSLSSEDDTQQTAAES